MTAEFDWLRDHWDLPQPPLRIHQHAVEPDSQLGSPKMAPAFLAYLEGSPYATTWVRSTDPCYHPRGVPCIDCLDLGYRDNDRELYRHPMAAALAQLRKVPPPAPDRPSYYDLVVALAASGWDVHAAALALGIRIVTADQRKTEEARFILAIRKLQSRYSSGPIGKTPKWTDLSESQQRAIENGEAA